MKLVFVMQSLAFLEDPCKCDRSDASSSLECRIFFCLILFIASPIDFRPWFALAMTFLAWVFSLGALFLGLVSDLGVVALATFFLPFSATFLIYFLLAPPLTRVLTCLCNFLATYFFCLATATFFLAAFTLDSAFLMALGGAPDLTNSMVFSLASATDERSAELDPEVGSLFRES